MVGLVYMPAASLYLHSFDLVFAFEKISVLGFNAKMSLRALVFVTMAAAASSQIIYQSLNSVSPRPALARFGIAPVVQPEVAVLQPRVALPQIQVPVQRTTLIDEDGPAEYQFRYAVQDPLTGDYKSQEESRLNDIVKGQYTIAQPDGLLRIVDYGANDATGFSAIVRYEPLTGRLAVATPVAANVAVATPTVTRVA